jgi:hypothetical protein
MSESISAAIIAAFSAARASPDQLRHLCTEMGEEVRLCIDHAHRKHNNKVLLEHMRDAFDMRNKRPRCDNSHDDVVQPVPSTTDPSQKMAELVRRMITQSVLFKAKASYKELRDQVQQFHTALTAGGGLIQDDDLKAHIGPIMLASRKLDSVSSHAGRALVMFYLVDKVGKSRGETNNKFARRMHQEYSTYLDKSWSKNWDDHVELGKAIVVCPKVMVWDLPWADYTAMQDSIREMLHTIKSCESFESARESMAKLLGPNHEMFTEQAYTKLRGLLYDIKPVAEEEDRGRKRQRTDARERGVHVYLEL